MNEELVTLAIQEAPAAIGILKSIYKQKHPGVEPSDVQIVAAWQSAFASSLAKDEAWLRAHPAT